MKVQFKFFIPWAYWMHCANACSRCGALDKLTDFKDTNTETLADHELYWAAANDRTVQHWDVSTDYCKTVRRALR